MKLKKLILENFRGYYGRTEIDFDDLTAFIGKNDVGKSTILEALDIFFNDGKGTVKIEKEDLNKIAERAGKSEILIGAVFTDLPEKIVVDSTVEVTLEDEYLLNEDGDLEIHKIYRNGRLQGTYIYANHPANDDFLKNLMAKTVRELRDFMQRNGIECSGDKRKASDLRRCIREYYREKDGELHRENIRIPTTQGGGRDVWNQIQRYLPLYALFKADRTNTDENPEVQDPLKLAVKEVLQNQEIQDKLEEVARVVKETVEEIMDMTLEELKRINPEVASQLRPNIPDTTRLKWADVFKKITIVSDEGIPLNKRGSGVRRLVLLSFLAAQAKRRQEKEGLSSIIYAIEEPETSQHPDHQKLLINSLIKLSQSENTQIILTTHSPAIAQLLPVESLRLVKKEGEKTVVHHGDDKILLEIADTLGVMPTLSKVVVCVEGENDRSFLLNINQNIPELKEIIDLNSREIAIIPMRGGNLRSWIDRNYLEGTGVVEFHLYDRDLDEKYKDYIEKVKQRPPSTGTLTRKREMENYIHWSLIENEFGITIEPEIKREWDTIDVAGYLSKKLEEAGKKMKEAAIKRKLNQELSQKMTKELFEELGAWDEVRGWFETIRDLFNHTLPQEGVE